MKEIRLHKNFTQESLADAVGVTRQTIIAVEKEKFVPSVKLALELALALDTPIEKVFWLEKSRGGKS
ncbi:MAG: helix-turn-helix domain-containing protein [Chloroflexi bacterium]|nr:helix-turn-helix domain-containing protein [Chloroflexota bacterium]